MVRVGKGAIDQLEADECRAHLRLGGHGSFPEIRCVAIRGNRKRCKVVIGFGGSFVLDDQAKDLVGCLVLNQVFSGAFYDGDAAES